MSSGGDDEGGVEAVELPPGLVDVEGDAAEDRVDVEDEREDRADVRERGEGEHDGHDQVAQLLGALQFGLLGGDFLE